MSNFGRDTASKEAAESQRCVHASVARGHRRDLLAWILCRLRNSGAEFAAKAVAQSNAWSALARCAAQPSRSPIFWRPFRRRLPGYGCSAISPFGRLAFEFTRATANWIFPFQTRAGLRSGSLRRRLICTVSISRAGFPDLGRALTRLTDARKAAARKAIRQMACSCIRIPDCAAEP